jgi:hypothetical protein
MVRPDNQKFLRPQSFDPRDAGKLKIAQGWRPSGPPIAVLEKTFAPFQTHGIFHIIQPLKMPPHLKGDENALAPGVHIGMAFIRIFNRHFHVLVV